MTERVSDARLAELATWKPGAGTKALSAQREEWQAIARELHQRREAERWIPVAERLPDPHEVVQVLYGTALRPTGACWTGEVWLQAIGSMTLKRVVYWREIGTLPATEGEAA